MELLLNLLWFLLVMPAFWFWRRHDRSVSSLRCQLALACGLVLLFPVVSATDDLQAMQPEMVESGPLKSTLTQWTIEKASGRSQFSNSSAILTFVFVLEPSVRFWGQPRVRAFFWCAPVQTKVLSTRAPPVFFLA